MLRKSAKNKRKTVFLFFFIIKNHIYVNFNFLKIEITTKTQNNVFVGDLVGLLHALSAELLTFMSCDNFYNSDIRQNF